MSAQCTRRILITQEGYHWVHWEVFSTPEGYTEYIGGYQNECDIMSTPSDVQYTRRIHPEDTMESMGDIMSTPRNFQYTIVLIQIQWEWTKIKCSVFMQSCGTQQENEVQHRTLRKCYCVCVGLQNKIHMFREYFLSFTAIIIKEKVEVTRKATDKTSAIPCRRYDNCLGAANLYSRTIKSSTKTCIFKD